MLRSAGVLGSCALAGCLGSPFGDACSAGTDFTLEATTDDGIAAHVSATVAELPPVAGRIADEALADGETTYRSYHEPGIHEDFVRREGESAYYRLDVSASEHVETTGYRYEFALGEDVGTPARDDRVLGFADLPPPDRESILAAVGPKARLAEARGARFPVVFAYVDGATRERSAFVPPVGTTYLRWQGRTLRVTFAEERPATVVTYAITAEPVARSTSALVDRVLDRRGVVLDDLSAEQRDVVEAAIDGGYDACEPYSDAFAGLLDRLSTGEHDFASFVRYEGTWYVARVSQWVE